MLDRPLILTQHAHRRAREMGVELDEIRLAVHEPESDYTSPSQHGEGKRIAARGRIAVVYSDDAQRRIITVLWHGQDGR